MYRIILYAIVFLILLIVVAFLLTRRMSRIGNLQYIVPQRRFQGGLIRRLTPNIPKTYVGESTSLEENEKKYQILTGIEFLTDHKTKNVLIMGAKPSDLLINLFPTRVFHDMKSVDELVDKPVVIISYLPATKKNLEEVARVVEKLSPIAISVRYNPVIINRYFSGELYIPPYISGTDTQLISKSRTYTTYNTNDYLARMSFFNARIKLYGYNEQVEEYVVNMFKRTESHLWIKEKIMSELSKI